MNMNSDVTISLPGSIASYFDATNRFDAASAAACFTPDGAVRDEGNTYIGTEAIRNWVSQASEKYRPHASVVSARENGDRIVVAVRVTGQFPGSPAELEFEFFLRKEAIAELTIQ